MKWEKTANARSRKGFTIVEVVIVLAITGLIFVGAVAGIGSSLARQAQQALTSLQTQFDLVFLDPPYNLNLWEELALQADHLVKNNAYIYVEADRDLQLLKLPASWRLIKNTKAGTVRAGLYQKSVS